MKIKTGLILFILLSSVVISQSINFTSPTGGEKWEVNKGYYLLWDKTGQMVGTVIIRLMSANGSVKVLNIANKAPNSGKYFWKIPVSLPPGQYSLRIKTVDNKFSADSKPIEIGNGDKKELTIMDIVSPKSGQVFTMGNSIPIEWISTGISGNSLKVFLCKGAKGVQIVSTITSNWPNQPHFQSSWVIPHNISAGNYKIVVLEGTSTFHHGNIFTIKLPASLMIKKPNMNVINQFSSKTRTMVSRGTKPYILSFYPDKLAKRIPPIPGAGDLFLVKLNFYWKDDDGDLLNGKWHFSYESVKPGFKGGQSGSFNSKYSENFKGIKGSVIGFEAMYINGKANDQVRIFFVLEDEHGHFSDKMTGLVTLSPGGEIL